MTVGSNPFGDSFERQLAQERALRQLADETRRIEEALAPRLEIERALQRDREAFEQSTGFRYLKALEEDARRHKELMDAVERASGSRYMKAVQDNALRHKDLLDAMEQRSANHLKAVEDDARRQKVLIDSLTRLPFPDLQKAELLSREASKYGLGPSVVQSMTALHPALEALYGMRLNPDLLRVLQEDGARQRMFQAALFAVDNARGMGITTVDAATLSLKVVEALDSEDDRGSNESPTDLLTFAIQLAIAISSRLSNVSPNVVLKSVVLPLLVAFISGGVFYELTSRDNEHLAVRIETDLAQELSPRRLIATKDVSVREFANKSATLVGTLPVGTEVEELDRDERGWRYVRTIDPSRKIEGWASNRNFRPK